MVMERESFIFYASFYEAMKCLDDTAYVAVSKAINEYALYGNEIELTGTAKGFFQLIKPQIDANNKRYECGRKGAEFGKLGGRPRKENPKETPNMSVLNFGGTNENPNKTPNCEKTDFLKPQENPKETPNMSVLGFNGENENPKITPSKPQNNPEITPKKPQENPKETPNVNVNENENENENVKGVIGGKNFAADKSATLTENDFSDSAIENPASPEKEKSCAKKEKAELTIDVDERARRFTAQVFEQYADQYPREMLVAFADYWTEHNPGGKKMRYEMEKIFDLPRRLATWAKRDKEYSARRGATTTTQAKQPDSRLVNSIWK